MGLSKITLVKIQANYNGVKRGRGGNKMNKKPSTAVKLTKSRSYLLIYSFKRKSAFDAVKVE